LTFLKQDGRTDMFMQKLPWPLQYVLVSCWPKVHNFSHPSLSAKASKQQQQQQNADGVHPDVFSNNQVIHIWAKTKSIESMKWVNGGFERCGALPGTSPSNWKSTKPNA
jgi:hypothetical protein